MRRNKLREEPKKAAAGSPWASALARAPVIGVALETNGILNR